MNVNTRTIKFILLILCVGIFTSVFWYERSQNVPMYSLDEAEDKELMQRMVKSMPDASLAFFRDQLMIFQNSKAISLKLYTGLKYLSYNGDMENEALFKKHWWGFVLSKSEISALKEVNKFVDEYRKLANNFENELSQNEIETITSSNPYSLYSKLGVFRISGNRLRTIENYGRYNCNEADQERLKKVIKEDQQARMLDIFSTFANTYERPHTQEYLLQTIYLIKSTPRYSSIMPRLLDWYSALGHFLNETSKVQQQKLADGFIEMLIREGVVSREHALSEIVEFIKLEERCFAPYQIAQ